MPCSRKPGTGPMPVPASSVPPLSEEDCVLRLWRLTTDSGQEAMRAQPNGDWFWTMVGIIERASEGGSERGREGGREGRRGTRKARKQTHGG